MLAAVPVPTLAGGRHGHGFRAHYGPYGWRHHAYGLAPFVLHGGVVLAPLPPPPPYWYWPYPPPPEDPAPPDRPPPRERRAREPIEEDEDPLRASYGLLQLRGVPDGAAVDLDGRFWMTAASLERRWLAVPHGEHAITVYVEGKKPLERRVVVAAGRTHVVRVGPYADVTS
jgi:hypothetical protein